MIKKYDGFRLFQSDKLNNPYIVIDNKFQLGNGDILRKLLDNPHYLIVCNDVKTQSILNGLITDFVSLFLTIIFNSEDNINNLEDIIYIEKCISDNISPKFMFNFIDLMYGKEKSVESIEGDEGDEVVEDYWDNHIKMYLNQHILYYTDNEDWDMCIKIRDFLKTMP